MCSLISAGKIAIKIKITTIYFSRNLRLCYTVKKYENKYISFNIINIAINQLQKNLLRFY